MMHMYVSGRDSPTTIPSGSHCERSVHEPNVLSSFGLAFEQKQIPRFVENSGNQVKEWDQGVTYVSGRSQRLPERLFVFGRRCNVFCNVALCFLSASQPRPHTDCFAFRLQTDMRVMLQHLPRHVARDAHDWLARLRPIRIVRIRRRFSLHSHRCPCLGIL
jgi:hypothetical protein